MSEIVPVPDNTQSGKFMLADKIMDRLAKAIDDTDEKEAATRVAKLRAKHPDDTLERLTNRLVLAKVRETAVVGATTSAAMIIPGIGTIAGLTLGIAADFGITFKLQAELVLEIASLYGHPMTPDEKRRVVMLVTGLSAGTTTLAHRAGKGISKRLTARIGSKYMVRAMPVVGMAASATTNAFMTYAIGKRAQAYFSLGPEAMGDWRASAGALTGINRELLASGAKTSGVALKKVGGTAVTGAKKVGSAVASRRPRLRRNKKQLSLPDNSEDDYEDEIIPIFIVED
ncbi:MAG: DUF697 domain-containing protein [Aquificales bacterium]|nr:DUF697 domain-containing protein [Aquificales bacterium]